MTITRGALVYAVDGLGVLLFAPIKASLTTTDPDTMIEEMGYTVITEES